MREFGLQDDLLHMQPVQFEQQPLQALDPGSFLLDGGYRDADHDHG